MAVNVVKYAGKTLVDMRDATAKAANILSGYKAYGADGKLITGTAQASQKIETEVSLPVSGWSGNQQTVRVSGVTENATVIVCSDSGCETEYAGCEVYCSGQGSGTLTFSCTYIPVIDLTAMVTIFP